MSKLIVKLTTIDSVEKHPNADRLDLVTVGGWVCVTGLGVYKPGDPVIYLEPENSVLPDELCQIIWPEGGAIKAPKGGRLRTEKIRKCLSQGMVLNPKDEELLSRYPDLKKSKVGDDVSDILGITKYVPPEPPAHLRGEQAREHSKFSKYTDLQNIKHFPDLFNGMDVVVTEKLHGTNARFSVQEKESLTIWERVKKFFGLKVDLEFLVGSRNCVLKHRDPNHDLGFGLGTAGDNVYTRTAKQYSLDKKLRKGEILYGEIINVQKGYHYGLKEGQTAFVAFDLKKEGKFLNHADFLALCRERGIPTAPVLFVGKFDLTKILEMTEGVSVQDKGQLVREGVVIRTTEEGNNPMTGRNILKSINPKYLLKEQSEYQ